MTPAGRGFLGATLLFLHFTLCSLDIQAYVGLAYATGLWVTALAAARLCRPRVQVTVHGPERMRAGEQGWVDVEVAADGGTASGDLRVLLHRLPPGVEALEEHGLSLPAPETDRPSRVRLHLRCARRGSYRLGGARVQTGFPFGLLVAARASEEHSLIVHPRFTPLAHLGIPGGRRHHPEGVALASSVGDSQEYWGSREYRFGDSLRDVDWRATARLGKPIVREFREEYFLRTAVVLDTYLPRGSKPERFAAFEWAVSVTAAVSDYLLRRDYLVEFCAAGPNLYHFTAGRSLAHLDQMLDILAHVDVNPEEAFSEIGPELAANLLKTTSVVCVFLDWDETRRRFVASLRDGGTSVRVILVRDGAPTRDPELDRSLTGDVPVVTAERFAEGVDRL
jgi:uncharacterized protein (DUF58 family)